MVAITVGLVVAALGDGVVVTDAVAGAVAATLVVRVELVSEVCVKRSSMGRKAAHNSSTSGAGVIGAAGFGVPKGVTPSAAKSPDTAPDRGPVGAVGAAGAAGTVDADAARAVTGVAYVESVVAWRVVDWAACGTDSVRVATPVVGGPAVGPPVTLAGPRCPPALETVLPAVGARWPTVAAPVPEVDAVVVPDGWADDPDGPLAAVRVVVPAVDDPVEGVEPVALFGDVADPPVSEVSAWATPDALASTAPTPRVIAPAPSQAYG